MCAASAKREIRSQHGHKDEEPRERCHSSRTDASDWTELPRRHLAHAHISPL